MSHKESKKKSQMEDNGLHDFVEKPLMTPTFDLKITNSKDDEPEMPYIGEFIGE